MYIYFAITNVCYFKTLQPAMLNKKHSKIKKQSIYKVSQLWLKVPKLYHDWLRSFYKERSNYLSWIDTKKIFYDRSRNSVFQWMSTTPLYFHVSHIINPSFFKDISQSRSIVVILANRVILIKVNVNVNALFEYLILNIFQSQIWFGGFN